MDISIIIVNWNTKKLLLKCIDSILKDIRNFNVEIIVVDNASTDDSVQAVNDRFDSVKVIRNSENLGFAKANNIGINESTGKYICLINSDIVVKSGCFNNLFEYMEKKPSIGMIGPRLLNTNGTLQTSCKKFPSIWNTTTRALFLHKLFPNYSIFSTEEMNYFKHDKIIEVDALAGAFLMVRKEALVEIGLLDENYFFYSEDIDWCFRFWQYRWSVVFFPYSVCVHHDGGSSKKSPIKFHLQLIKSKYIYMQKHHSALKILMFQIIMLNQYIIRIITYISMYLFIKNKKQTNGDFQKYLMSFNFIFKQLFSKNNIERS